jgi:hypothetical protein
MSPLNADTRDVELVTRGYTISDNATAFARIGARYVMRDRRGHQVALPLATHPDRLLQAWMDFRHAAAANMREPEMMTSETITLSNEVVAPHRLEWHWLEADGFAAVLVCEGPTRMSLIVERRPGGRWEWQVWRQHERRCVFSGRLDDAISAMEQAELVAHTLANASVANGSVANASVARQATDWVPA